MFTTSTTRSPPQLESAFQSQVWASHCSRRAALRAVCGILNAPETDQCLEREANGISICCLMYAPACLQVHQLLLLQLCLAPAVLGNWVMLHRHRACVQTDTRLCVLKCSGLLSLFLKKDDCAKGKCVQKGTRSPNFMGFRLLSPDICDKGEQIARSLPRRVACWKQTSIRQHISSMGTKVSSSRLAVVCGFLSQGRIGRKILRSFSLAVSSSSSLPHHCRGQSL